MIVECSLKEPKVRFDLRFVNEKGQIRVASKLRAHFKGRLLNGVITEDGRVEMR